MANVAGADVYIHVGDSSEEKSFEISPQHCCIYKIPPEQRQLKPEAYIPQLVLIGPLHHAKKQAALEMQKQLPTDSNMENIIYRYNLYLFMENQKQRYYKNFCSRAASGLIEKARKLIEDSEVEIRKCYAEPTTLIETDDFVKSILYDAIFIIEYMFRALDRALDQSKHEDDLIFKTLGFRVKLNSDLILLENQLPYSVLENLYNSCFGFLEGLPSFYELSCFTFGFHVDKNISRDRKIKHFTDLARYQKIQSFHLTKGGKRSRCAYNAEKLEQSGVNFVAMDKKDNNHSINVEFTNSQLRIAPFEVYDETELQLRNIMALEQCHYPREAHVCSYILLLDSLIDTGKDVGILVDEGIFKNHIGHDGMLADIVNKLTHGIVETQSHYSEVIEQLEDHHNMWWNRSKAILRRNYCPHIWGTTATVVGIILLVLTFIQTGVSVVEIFHGLGD